MQLLLFSYLTIACFSASLFFLYKKRFAAEKYCAAGGCLFCGLILVILMTAKGNLPVFGDFESSMCVTGVLGILVLFCSPRQNAGTTARGWAYGFILVLLLLSLYYPKVPSPDEHNHQYIWVIFFHGFRRIALAAMLFSSCFYIQYRKNRRRGVPASMFSHQGRNYLLAAAICFLVSEYAGMIWCQNGWGDFWHWSNAFFQSTLVLLYLMAAFHIPGRNGNFDRARSLIGSLSGVFFLTMMMIRSLI